jgi:hypothetical protein
VVITNYQVFDEYPFASHHPCNVVLKRRSPMRKSQQLQLLGVLGVATGAVLVAAQCAPECSGLGCDDRWMRFSVPSDATSDVQDAARDAKPKKDVEEPEAIPFDAGDATLAEAGLAGTWRPMPVAINPNLLVADDPSVIEPLAFEPCPSGRAGCTQLKKSWTTFKGAGLRLRTPSEGVVHRGADGKVHITYERTFPKGDFSEGPETWMTVVQELRGLSVFAAYQRAAYDQSVTIAGRGVSDNCFGFGVYNELGPTRYIGTYDYATRQVRVWRSPTESLPKLAGTVARSADQLFQRLDNRSYVIFDLPSQTWLGGEENAKQIPIEVPRGLPTGAIGTHNDIPLGITYTDKLGNWTRVTSPVGRRYVTGFALDRTQQNCMYWMESADIGPAKG